MSQEQQADPELPLATLVGRLSSEALALARDEIALAKLEVSERAQAASKGAGPIGVVVLFAVLGILSLTASLVIAVGHLIGYALSALLVGLGFLLIAAVAGLIARGRLQRVVAPIALPEPSQQAALPEGRRAQDAG